jgi:conjugative relaxase-like TrwC/TraI family protein
VPREIGALPGESRGSLNPRQDGAIGAKSGVAGGEWSSARFQCGPHTNRTRKPLQTAHDEPSSDQLHAEPRTGSDSDQTLDVDPIQASTSIPSTARTHHVHPGGCAGRRRRAAGAVLSIGKIGASRTRLDYYERQVAAGIEDYYAARGEEPGRWIGGGCGGLGLSGRVDRDGFFALMEGRDPTTGKVLRPPHGRTRVAAFDLTFSAPKSVSVLYAIGDQPVARALLEAHGRAVDAALAYVEREACFTRRGKDGVRRVRGEGFVAAAYRHRLSRAGDPQLHTHVVVANMTRAEGRWTSLDGHGLYEHKSAAGAVYRAVLRAEVRERLPWVWWRQTGRGLFEIDGVPDAVLQEFSRRRMEIEERARELTGVAASELCRERVEGIALATRKAKEYGVDGARWREEARARAAEHGLGARELGRFMFSPPRGAVASEFDVVASATTRLSGPEGLTGQHNTFAHRHAMAEIASEFAQGATIAQLDRATHAYLEDSSVVSLGGRDGEDRFTTRELLGSEHAIVATARRRTSRDVATLRPAVIDASLRRAGIELNAEPAAAVQAIAGSSNGVDVLQALAGTGKTRVLGALAGCYRDAGYLVLGVAPTGRAARELAEAIGTQAVTLHAVVNALDRAGDLLPRTVVLMDEAGMAPTLQSAVLFKAAERAGAKLIAAGDVGQLPSGSGRRLVRGDHPRARRPGPPCCRASAQPGGACGAGSAARRPR